MGRTSKNLNVAYPGLRAFLALWLSRLEPRPSTLLFWLLVLAVEIMLLFPLSPS